jgi:hypothetical protein
MKGINTFLICFLIIFSNIVNAQSVDRVKKGQVQRMQDDNGSISLIPINREPLNYPFVTELAAGFVYGDVIIGPELATSISGFYDYKTNGESNHYIQQDPTNPLLIHAIDMQADSTDATGVTSRRIKYAFSIDGGLVWSFADNVPGIRAGYGVLALKSDGSAIIANHSQPGAILNANLYVDAFPGLGSFTEYLAQAPSAIWPQISVLSNGNVIMLSRPQSSTSGAQNDTLYYCIWNGTSFGPKQVFWIATPPYAGDVAFSNMAFNVADNNNGTVGMIANPEQELDVFDSPIVHMKISTDNASTFGNAFDIFTPFLENGNQDTVFIAGGHDLTFKPGTNDWFWAAVGTADGLFAKTRVFMIRGTGSTVTSTQVIADTVNLPMMARTYTGTWAFQFPIDHPKLGWSEDGGVLYCSYDVVTADTGARGWNTRDVFYMWSTNNGINWSDPVRITNTPTIDEGFPSISDWNMGTTSLTHTLNMSYMKDPGDGPTSFNGTGPLFPATRNTMIYRKMTLASTNISNSITNLNDYKLLQNYPNPFNPSTTITYNLPRKEFVTLKVYNVLGKEVASLVNATQDAGIKNITFDASRLASGLYFYSISAGDFKDIKKMMLIK